jgi:hypothetical protein
MNTDGPDLERLVRRQLTDAGFTIEPFAVPADGGLSVCREPGRGVVVRWGVPVDGDRVRHDTIRNAVQLALRTILTDAGFRVLDCDDSETVVVASP